MNLKENFQNLRQITRLLMLYLVFSVSFISTLPSGDPLRARWSLENLLYDKLQ